MTHTEDWVDEIRADVPSLTAPVAERSTLAALMSRWIFPSEWRYSRPTNSSLQTIAICASVKTPGLSWDSRQRHVLTRLTRVQCEGTISIHVPGPDNSLRQDTPSRSKASIPARNCRSTA
jgi:hypothetical protein